MLSPTKKGETSSNATVTITISGMVETLDDLFRDILTFTPSQNSNGFVKPDSSEQADWNSVVTQILNGDCDNVALPASLQNAYSVSSFTDSDNNDDYCILMEILDENEDNKSDKGWGTFVLNKDPLRHLSIQVPDPLGDADIVTQSIGLFKETDSQSFSMAGTHANANMVSSDCQNTFSESDSAHNLDTLFHQTQIAIKNFHSTTANFSAIQFNKMSESICSDVNVYMSYGTNQIPNSTDNLTTLQSHLSKFNPDWKINVPGGTPLCSENGSDSIQGRLFNEVNAADLCMQNATNYTGKYIHIEQKAGFENADNWKDAIQQTWPSIKAFHTFTLELERGWNLVSIPLETNTSVTELFSSILVGKVWRFVDGKFQPVTNLLPKVGYWLFSNSKTPIPVTGTEISNFNVVPTSQWNLVGPSDQAPFNASTINFVDHIISTNGFHPSIWCYKYPIFEVTDSYSLGKGYWLYGD